MRAVWLAWGFCISYGLLNATVAITETNIENKIFFINIIVKSLIFRCFVLQK